MRDVTSIFTEVFAPQSFVVFNSEGNNNEAYVEAYDLNEKGKPINGHPLTVLESAALADKLNSCKDLRNDYLISKRLLPENVLYLKPGSAGFAVWYTPAKLVKLLFSNDLNIPCGEAYVPPMVWKADKRSLFLYALKTSKRPGIKTNLYYSPYFNVKADESICMGTVDVDHKRVRCLEDFITAWETYFFNSYFSHSGAIQAPIKGSLLELWQELVSTKKRFPVQLLKKNGKTLNDLIA